eukprot:6277646-Amphidinium_carterae.1
MVTAILAQSQAASKDRNDQLDIDLCGQYDQAQHPVAALQVLAAASQCAHESEAEGLQDGEAGTSSGNYIVLAEGMPLRHSVAAGKTKNYLYENLNSSTMDQPDRYQRETHTHTHTQTQRYYSDAIADKPKSLAQSDKHLACFEGQSNEVSQAHPIARAIPVNGSSAAVQPPPCSPANYTISCDWTHFRSTVDGSKDGAPTFFEVPLASARHYITVYAPDAENLALGIDRPQFRLLALADIGAYPRPGQKGIMTGRQVSENEVELTWEPSTFVPLGVSELRYYQVYSSLLLPGEQRASASVMVSPSKVMNTVCGLERNAV